MFFWGLDDMTTKQMPAVPVWDKLSASGNVGVDRESKTIKGYVVAQTGDFKTPGRGAFDQSSLSKMVELWPEDGLKSRFHHPTMSNDGLGKFLGRAVNPRIDGDKLRADLVLNPSSFSTPAGNLGEYVLTLAETDPEAFSSSLVLQADKTYTMDDQNRPKRDANGDKYSPHWMPTKLHASDVVDTGEAVDGFLSVELNEGELPDAAVRKASEVLDTVFAGQTQEVVTARASEFLSKYIERRFGIAPTQSAKTKDIASDIRFKELELIRLSLPPAE
jgi:hypothetical protein